MSDLNKEYKSAWETYTEEDKKALFAYGER